MKCSKCGAEIKSGSVYCGSCGEAVQMVPDYNLLEDDFFVSILLNRNRLSQVLWFINTAAF